MSVFDDMQAIEYDKKVNEYSKKTDSYDKNMIAANKMPAEYRKMMIECCKTNILNGDNMHHGAQIRIILRPTCMIYVQLLKKKKLFLLQIIKIAVSLQNLN